MAKPLSAVDYLAQPDKHPPRPVCAVFGDEAFLRRQAIARLRRAVLGDDEGDFSLTVFPGRSAEFLEVAEELATMAMFGPSRRLVLVEEAGEFVKRFRSQLEDYVASPDKNNILVLEVSSWPANTRLAKAVAAAGLAIQCKTPAGAQLGSWLVRWAKQSHGFQLTRPAADLLVDMVEPELGLLDQELAKLALLADPQGRVTPAQVGQAIGTWRAKTTWDMLDSVLDGNAQEAMVQLDRLLLAGEQPIAVLGKIAASLRRLAAATRLIRSAEAAGRRIALRDALRQAGVQPFVLEKTQRQLRRLGRHRGAKLYRWLLQADLDLKGASHLPPRLILERLLVRLAAQAPNPNQVR